jgi:hypothetical protein
MALLGVPGMTEPPLPLQPTASQTRAVTAAPKHSAFTTLAFDNVDPPLQRSLQVQSLAAT